MAEHDLKQAWLQRPWLFAIFFIVIGGGGFTAGAWYMKAEKDYAVSAKDNAIAAQSNVEAAANLSKSRAEADHALVVKERDDLRVARDALAVKVDDLSKQALALTQDLDRQKAEVARLKAKNELPKASSKPISISDLDPTSQSILGFLFRVGPTNLFTIKSRLKLMDGDARQHIEGLASAKLIEVSITTGLPDEDAYYLVRLSTVGTTFVKQNRLAGIDGQ
jgi:hypothetical protein